jgi:hypothetical protein
VSENTLKLKEYIDEISLLQEKEIASLSELQECYEKYSFSDEEKEKLISISQSHKKRSEELLLSRKVNSAIISMERAVEINPFSDEYRNTLAQLYLMRAQKEGFKKSDRDLAYQHATYSLKITNSNPIARSILKEIQKNDDKISGKDLNKKFLPLLLIIAVFALVALFTEKKYLLPFFGIKETEEEETWIKPPEIEKAPFDVREVETQINGLQNQFSMEIEKSLIKKINGSYSYILQGEILSEKETIESADLSINFINTEGDSLFSRTLPLVRENQLILPGEAIVIDQFFYIHYLPPDIDKINLTLRNYSFSDKTIPAEKSIPLKIEWETSRPEGIEIQMSLKNEDSIINDSQSYKNIKMLLENKSLTAIENLEIQLSWRNSYGEIIYQIPKRLIRRDSLPLKKEKSRIFYLFTEIPEIVNQEENEFFIEIDRIN